MKEQAFTDTLPECLAAAVRWEKCINSPILVAKITNVEPDAIA